jgi:hypothetical protein
MEDQAMNSAYLQLHLEPAEPLEVAELTAALNAFAHRYQVFAASENAGGEIASGKLLVASVQPGSIDINFIPEAVAAAAPLIPHILNQALTLSKFAGNLKSLLDMFASKKAIPTDVSIRDCEDVVNICKPIADHGGSQTFNVFNGPAIVAHFSIDRKESQRALEGATRCKSALLSPMDGTRQRVSMIWKRLDRDEAKTKGTRSPDLGLIEEIDPRPHAVMFTDEMSYLKREMIGDVENPYQKVYFIDVDVSRIGDKITAYRIIGYHGSDDFDDNPPLL